MALLNNVHEGHGGLGVEEWIRKVNDLNNSDILCVFISHKLDISLKHGDLGKTAKWLNWIGLERRNFGGGIRN